MKLAQISCAAWPLAAALVFSAPQGMRTYRSKESNIKSNASAAEAQAVGKRVDYYCRLFEEFYGDLGLRKKNDNLLKLRLFATHDEYEEYYERGGGGLGSTPLAYFSPSLNSIVMYSDERDVALQAVFFHEASHQFLNRYTYDAPKWLNEGLAEYFEGWKVETGVSGLRRPHFYDLALVKNAIRDERTLGLRELIEMDAETFNDFSDKYPSLHPYLHYATSWSVVYHCLEGGVEEDRERLIQYLEDLTRKGAKASFEVQDWGPFVARWRATVLALEPQPTDAADHFLIASGARANGEFRAAAASLEKSLELDPAMPGARYWLGYAYKRMGDYPKAVEQLERAALEEPENPRAPYYLARIHLGIDSRSAEPDAAKALECAQRASSLVNDENPIYLWLVAQCQLARGEGKDAVRTAKRMVKVADAESREGWEARAEEIQAEAKKP